VHLRAKNGNKVGSTPKNLRTAASSWAEKLIMRDVYDLIRLDSGKTFAGISSNSRFEGELRRQGSTLE